MTLLGNRTVIGRYVCSGHGPVGCIGPEAIYVLLHITVYSSE
jgi:hypothetical protein